MDIEVVCNESERAAIETALGEHIRVLTPSSYAPGTSAIIWLDGLAPGELESLTAAIPAAQPRPIAVRGTHWDGFEPIALAAHCRGIISGFGIAGIEAAISTLRSESHAE